MIWHKNTIRFSLKQIERKTGKPKRVKAVFPQCFRWILLVRPCLAKNEGIPSLLASHLLCPQKRTAKNPAMRTISTSIKSWESKPYSILSLPNKINHFDRTWSLHRAEKVFFVHSFTYCLDLIKILFVYAGLHKNGKILGTSQLFKRQQRLLTCDGRVEYSAGHYWTFGHWGKQCDWHDRHGAGKRQ